MTCAEILSFLFKKGTEVITSHRGALALIRIKNLGRMCAPFLFIKYFKIVNNFSAANVSER